MNIFSILSVDPNVICLSPISNGNTWCWSLVTVYSSQHYMKYNENNVYSIPSSSYSHAHIPSKKTNIFCIFFVLFSWWIFTQHRRCHRRLPILLLLKLSVHGLIFHEVMNSEQMMTMRCHLFFLFSILHHYSPPFYDVCAKRKQFKQL